MYTQRNYKTKKALKYDVSQGVEVRIFSPGIFPAPTEGTVWLEGPHAPAAHTWYAEAELVNGVVVKVK